MTGSYTLSIVVDVEQKVRNLVTRAAVAAVYVAECVAVVVAVAAAHTGETAAAAAV